jgi:hypothetical protein
MEREKNSMKKFPEGFYWVRNAGGILQDLLRLIRLEGEYTQKVYSLCKRAASNFV